MLILHVSSCFSDVVLAKDSTSNSSVYVTCIFITNMVWKGLRVRCGLVGMSFWIFREVQTFEA